MKITNFLPALFILTFAAPGCEADPGPSGPESATLSWEDVQSVDMDGSAREMECGEHESGESWVAEGCFACSCNEEGQATCFLAVCEPMADDADPGFINMDDVRRQQISPATFQETELLELGSQDELPALPDACWIEPSGKTNC
jgi:hypothetical protein